MGVYEYLNQFLQSAASIQAAVKDICVRSVREGVVHLELRLLLRSHGVEGLSETDALLAALEGFSQGQAATMGMLSGGLVLCVPRDADRAAASAAVQLAADYSRSVRVRARHGSFIQPPCGEGFVPIHFPDFNPCFSNSPAVQGVIGLEFGGDGVTGGATPAALAGPLSRLAPAMKVGTPLASTRVRSIVMNDACGSHARLGRMAGGYGSRGAFHGMGW